MKSPRLKGILFLTLVAILLAFQGNALQVSAAQTAGEVVLSAPDISRFPLVSFSLEMFDSSGNFIADLAADQVKVLEDGQVKLPCRQAFLYYTLRRLGLHTKEAPDPLAQQITLKNRDEIQP
mgnify:CR=1 FL=1